MYEIRAAASTHRIQLVVTGAVRKVAAKALDPTRRILPVSLTKKERDPQCVAKAHFA